MLRRFRDLVDAHQHRVFTFACYYLGDHADAEDVTQEVLLRLWQNLEAVEPATARAWLARVTRNACYDHLRSRRSRRRVFPAALDEETGRAADAAADTAARVRAWDARRQLESALAQLAEPYRTIVIMREVQGMKYQEISEALGMPLNTVKTYIHRGRRMLRESLRESEAHV